MWLGTDMRILGKLPTGGKIQVETFRETIIHQRFDHYTEIIMNTQVLKWQFICVENSKWGLIGMARGDEGKKREL